MDTVGGAPGRAGEPRVAVFRWRVAGLALHVLETRSYGYRGVRSVYEM